MACWSSTPHLHHLLLCKISQPSMRLAAAPSTSRYIHFPTPPQPRRHRSFMQSRRHSGLSAAHTAVDGDVAEALNQVSNNALIAMLDSDEALAREGVKELQHFRKHLEDDSDQQMSLFLRVLQGMLEHVVYKSAAELEGAYLQAFNRLCNQVAGSEWRLTEEGKPTAVEDCGPQFSTWDEVIGKKKAKGPAAEPSGSPAGGPLPRVVDTVYYRVLGVAIDADQAAIKSAYRQAALKVHPDVSDAPDATERFATISAAYDALSNPESRLLYDRHGPEGMRRFERGDAGRGAARAAWDEFKQHVRSNKHTQARDAVGSATDGARAGVAGDDWPPAMGNVVEYPLRAVEVADLQDGRSAGVGLLVGRNLDRGDAASLPPDQLDLCEIEPLRQQEPGSTRWIPDELGIPSFARFHEMRVLPVDFYDQRHDVWTITAELSEGCGGPELVEEIML